jgi:hypothetical protein
VTSCLYALKCWLSQNCTVWEAIVFSTVRTSNPDICVLLIYVYLFCMTVVHRSLTLVLPSLSCCYVHSQVVVSRCLLSAVMSSTSGKKTFLQIVYTVILPSYYFSINVAVLPAFAVIEVTYIWHTLLVTNPHWDFNGFCTSFHNKE